jgi:hypothetical protein
VAIYAAYGSNMDPALMLQRCPHSPFAGTGWLPGWRLTFSGQHGPTATAIATLVEDPTDQVFVALFDVMASDTRELDSWEAVDTGMTVKIKVRVSTLDGDVLSWLYVSTGYEGGLPSPRYLAMVADAAEAAGAPEDYVHELRSRPCETA